MSDFSTPPAAPTPAQPNNNAKNGAIAFFGIAVIILAIAIAAPGSKDEGTSSPTTTAYVSEIDPIGEGDIAPVSKYDAYYEHMLNNSGRANSSSKADVIQLGDLICQSLDEGNSIGAVVQVLANSSADSSDSELAAAAIYGAITYICPEYAAMLSAYLNSTN